MGLCSSFETDIADELYQMLHLFILGRSSGTAFNTLHFGWKLRDYFQYCTEIHNWV